MGSDKTRTQSPRGQELPVFFKWALFIGAILLILAFLIHSQYIVHRLRANERRLLNVYAKLYAAATSELSTGDELNFIFDEVIRPTDFPIIATSAEGDPQAWKGIGVAADDRSENSLSKVRRILKRMDERTDPIPLSVKETGQIVGYLHHGDSGLVRQLSWMPFIQIGMVGLFILIGFLGYRNIKRSEQRYIWVGMAKETAHQLGTPLSSLMGWLELMRAGGGEQGLKQERLNEILGQVENDLVRMNRIASRFSQIGSEPLLESQQVIPILSETVQYFRQRLPRFGQPIDISEKYADVPPLLVNRDLLGWVFENLIKNALDSLADKGGQIEIAAALSPDGGQVGFSITDTGRGIDPKAQRRIFNAGYTTKKRGWGLGLTLARRIVEEYHGGRIILKESEPDRRTTFLVTLPVRNQKAEGGKQ